MRQGGVKRAGFAHRKPLRADDLLHASLGVPAVFLRAGQPGEQLDQERTRAEGGM